MSLNRRIPFQFKLGWLFILVAIVAIPFAAWRQFGFLGLLLVWIAGYGVALFVVLSKGPVDGQGRRERWSRLGVLNIVAGITLWFGTSKYLADRYPGDWGSMPPPESVLCCLAAPIVLAGAILMIAARK